MSTGILAAAIAGKRCLYATMTRASSFEAMKVLKDHSDMQNFGATLNQATQTLTFPSGGFIRFVTIIDKKDAQSPALAGKDFDIANPFALEWPEIARRVGRATA